ncbi:HEAT repeat domain-containing protein [Pseudoduganella chitinolytica]|uniref:HEAT repeat domain-containing protein n=1 Tax=Pseudoduganella chitinolytica TaxID=34070 RepID=A0ABY8BEW6_9BURK|nr:HEAT repeat domain-containing protein [Pseudoduganella chitinolytica]WEF34455.1 HEAT repeat domain-containing protein [Pseudoduganella chitinolytica]
MSNPILMQWAPPPVRDFVTEAHAALQRHGPDHLPCLAAPLRALFDRPGMLAELVNCYLRRVASGAMDGGDPSIQVDMLLLCHAPALSLRVIKDRADVASLAARPWQETLVNYPANTLVLVRGAAPVTVQWYRLQPGARFDVFDATLAIRPDGIETYGDGSLIEVDARRRFPVLPEGQGATWIALASAPVNAQIVSFDRATLRPLGASMASEEHSVLCVLLELLDPAAPDYPLAAVTALTTHPDHHVRWAAVTALGRRDGAAALDIVRTLAQADRHRFVRNAARRTLARLATAGAQPC